MHENEWNQAYSKMMYRYSGVFTKPLYLTMFECCGDTLDLKPAENQNDKGGAYIEILQQVDLGL